MQKIVPHLWYDKEAGEAAEFYISLFENSKIINKTILNNTPSGTAEMFTITLSGQEFILLSAGPYFKFTPAISFFIYCNTAAEVEKFWDELTKNGEVLMPLGSYPFSEKYGWCMDKYGVSWQVIYVSNMTIKQKIVPNLMFFGDVYNKAEEAAEFYVSVFDNSKIQNVQRYGESEAPNTPGSIQLMLYTLEGLDFTAMDSAYEHKFSFNEAISFVVNCNTQEEIDYYWNRLSAVPEAEQCGWLKDKYGISWQVTPVALSEMMQDKDKEKVERITEAFLQMKKFDLEELQRVYNN